MEISRLREALDQSKTYEGIVTRRDPLYDKLTSVIDIVKEVIIENKCIIYGGTAIDYVLRLKGDKIYNDDMLEMPDLDFYYYDSIGLAYKLAKRLYDEGWTEARAISATHIETMRVDPGDNHFIADITYIPKQLFDTLPTVEYNGMRCVAPVFIRVDLHSSLSFPYDNPPREVIFARWSKDIKRFNLIDKHYPIKPIKTTHKNRPVVVPKSLRHGLYSGQIAYAIYSQLFIDWCHLIGMEVPDDLFLGSCTGESGNLTANVPMDEIDLIYNKPERLAEELGLTDIQSYERYFTLYPERTEGMLSGSGSAASVKLIIYSLDDRLLAYNSATFGESSFRFVCVQYLLKYCIGMSVVHSNKPALSQLLTWQYWSLMKMINLFEERLSPEECYKHPFFLSIKTYGGANINLTTRMQMNKIRHETKDIPLYTLPTNYYPNRGKPAPTFDYGDIYIFRESGEKK